MAHADIYKVNISNDIASSSSCDPQTSPLLSLRAAVICANKNPGPDKIVLPAGTYPLSIGCGLFDAACSVADAYPLANPEVGDLDILDHLTITGAGPGETTIVGIWEEFLVRNDKIFEVMPNIHLSIEGVAVQKGFMGIFAHENSSLLIRNSVISDNDLIGIRTLDGDSLIVEKGLIKRNHGLGIEADYTKTTVRDSLITSNGGDAGAGIRANQIDLVNSTVSLNKCTGPDICTCNAGGLTLHLSGISSQAGTKYLPSTIINSTISGNESCGNTGGLRVSGYSLTPLTITNSTIVGNLVGDKPLPSLFGEYGLSGESGGLGVAIGRSVTDGTVSYSIPTINLKSTIIANNKALRSTTKSPDCFIPKAPPGEKGSLVSNGYNMVRDPTGCTGLIFGDKTGIDPLLGPLQDNGGLTPTHYLLPGSPAIDRVAVAECPPPVEDQRGIKRPQGSQCDIGAVEVVKVKKESGFPGFFLKHDLSVVIRTGTSDPDRDIVIKLPPPPPPRPSVSPGGGLICSSNRDGTYSLVNSGTGEALVIDRSCSADGTLPADAVILLQGTVVPTMAPSSFGQTPRTGNCVSPLPSPLNTLVLQTDLSSPDQMTGNSFMTIFPASDRNAVFGQEFGTLDGRGMTTDFCFDSNLGVPDGEVTAQGTAVVTFDGGVNQAVNSKYKIESRVVEPVNTANPLIMNTMMTTVGTILNCHLRQGEASDLCNESFSIDRLDRTILRSEFTWSVDRFSGDQISEAATYTFETRLAGQITVLRMVVDQSGRGSTFNDPQLGLFESSVKVGDIDCKRNGIGDSVCDVVPVLQ